jgi:ATP-binding cassette, subfamily A (ABC1), member 3
LTAFLLNDYGNAQVSNFFIHFIFGGIAPIAILILRIGSATRNVGEGIGWILRLIPSFSFGYGISNVGNREYYS